MENKLQELTKKLYDEGLEKGRAEADRLVGEAKNEAAKIVAEARAQAEEIVKKARDKAEDVEKNTMTEIALAGKQAAAKIKSDSCTTTGVPRITVRYTLQIAFNTLSLWVLS